MSTTMVQRPAKTPTESTVDAEPPAPKLPLSSITILPPARTAWLGPGGWWVLGLGITFIVSAITASLLGAWSTQSPQTTGSDQAITNLLYLTWAIACVLGAMLVRSVWGVLAVPLTAIVGTFLGIVLAQIIFTTALYNLSGGFNAALWPQGEPDGWMLVLIIVMPTSVLLAIVGSGIGRLLSALRPAK